MLDSLFNGDIGKVLLILFVIALFPISIPILLVLWFIHTLSGGY